jgi:type I restriction-modification system DNA methylase subunit
MTTQDIVQKLWNLCDVLRDDGINYSDYVTELVLLLFIKMEYENTESGILQSHKLPLYARWPELRDKSGLNLLRHYRETLLKLSTSDDQLIAAIYADAQTSLKEPRHLEQLVKSLDGIDWFSARQDGLGVRRFVGKERQRNQEWRRSVLHAAPAHRHHRQSHQATARRNRARPGCGHRRLPDRG